MVRPRLSNVIYLPMPLIDTTRRESACEVRFPATKQVSQVESVLTPVDTKHFLANLLIGRSKCWLRWWGFETGRSLVFWSSWLQYTNGISVDNCIAVDPVAKLAAEVEKTACAVVNLWRCADGHCWQSW